MNKEKRVLTTLDNCDSNPESCYAQDADFIVHKSEVEAVNYLTTMKERLDTEELQCVNRELEASDCWVKLVGRASLDDINDAVRGDGLTAADVNIRFPGEHPGGDCTWITPKIRVYGLIY